MRTAVASVQPPGNPVEVVLALPASPLVVSYCAGDLVVDAAASTGGGGRALSFEWNVDDDSATQVDSTEIILRYPLSNRPEWNLDPDVAIEDQYIDPFNVRVTATNWLEAESSRLIRIEPTQLAVPNVYIEAGYDRTMFRWQALRVFAYAEAERCDGARLELEYDWYVVGTPVWSASLDPRYFELAPYALDAGGVYEIVVTVTDTRFATNTARTKMEVVASEVVAVVDGGGRSAAAGSTVVLDASRSYDPDGSELTFVWKRDGTPVGGGATLAAEAPAVGAVATYEVRASTNDASARSAEYETTLYGIAEPESGPAVTIEAPAGRVDCTSRVVVPASSAAAASNYSLAWGREGASDDIFARALAPTAAAVAAGARGRARARLRRDGRPRAGLDLHFRLAAQLGPSASFADVVVACNAAPAVGPLHGRARRGNRLPDALRPLRDVVGRPRPAPDLRLLPKRHAADERRVVAQLPHGAARGRAARAPRRRPRRLRRRDARVGGRGRVPLDGRPRPCATRRSGASPRPARRRTCSGPSRRSTSPPRTSCCCATPRGPTGRRRCAARPSRSPRRPARTPRTRLR